MSVGNPITRGLDLAMFDARFTPFTLDEAMNRPVLWNQLSTEKNGNDRNMFPDPTTIRTHDYYGVGPMVQAYEGEAFAFDAPQKGYAKTSTYVKFAKGVKFTEEFLEDNLYSAGDQIAGGIGKASTLTKDLEMAKILDNVNNTTYYTAQDGLAISSASHLLIPGGAVTLRNLPSTSSGLSYQGFKDMMNVMHRQKDERGYPDPACKKGDTINIVYQPEDLFVLNQILGNSDEPDTPNRNINTVRGQYNFVPIQNPYCTGTGAAANGTNRLWHFILPQREGIWHVVRKALTTSTYMEDGDKSMVYDARERYAWHVRDFRGIYSNGA